MSDFSVSTNTLQRYHFAKYYLFIITTQVQRVDMSQSTISCETNDDGLWDLLSRIKERSDNQKNIVKRDFDEAKATMQVADETERCITNDINIELRESAGNVKQLMDSMQEEIDSLKESVKKLELENDSLRQSEPCRCKEQFEPQLNLNNTIQSVLSIESDDQESPPIRKGFVTVIYGDQHTMESTHVIPVSETTTVRSLSQKAIDVIFNKLDVKIDINLMCLRVGVNETKHSCSFSQNSKNMTTDREREFQSLSDRELQSYHFFKEWINLYNGESYFAITVRLTELASLTRSTSVTRKMSFSTPRRVPSPSRVTTKEVVNNINTTNTPNRRRISFSFVSSRSSSTARLLTNRTPTLSKLDSWRRRL